MRFKRILLVVLLIAVFTFTALGVQKQKPFEGVTVTVFTQTPPFIAKPVQMFAPDWEAKTGGKVKLITAPWAELYEKMYSSFALGARKYDIVIFPAAWLPSFASNGFLQPLDKFIAEDKELNWEGILPVYRERIANWRGKTYAIPLDGDNHIFYYRTDALKDEEYQKKFKEEFGYDLPVPPKTWKQHRDIAKFFNGWDWDEDGDKEYGIVEAMRKGDQAYWTYFSRAAGYCALPGQPGGLFFNPKNMEPLINNPCHVKALKDWIKAKKYGVPGIINMDSGEIRSVFTVGNAAMAIDWGDIGVMGATSPESTVKGKVGYSIMPGSRKVWDYENKEWVDCTKNPERCGGNKINQAPYLAFGGWLAAIDKNSKNIEAAYDFISYLGNPENSYKSVTTPETGFNPYRESHFEKLAGWIGYGFPNPEDYLNAIRSTINHPNVQPDLRIPEASRYFEALDAQLALALAGEKTPQEALDRVAREWNQITGEIGVKKQLDAYRASLGLPVD